MLSQVHSFVLQGIEPLSCEVEVDVAEVGLPKTTIVGLPDAAVKESVERVRSAMTNSGYPFPMARMLVNLAPADIRKEGPNYDLPIAVGLLLAGQVIRTENHRELLFAGELALDGRIRPINGAINLAILARRMGMRGIVVPTANAQEAAAAGGVEVYPADTLTSVVGLLNETLEIEPFPEPAVERMLAGALPVVDFGDIRGQEAAKRALVIAAAGLHNLLMIGPAGTGKTMIAKALPGILPALSREEALEVTRIYSSVGQIPKGEPLMTQRPVRSPHHTVSSAALVGGGSIPKPGEVSLAHHGVLFLDEMPEFPRQVLETLRQPLEDRCVTIARSHSAIRLPARFMLVAAMNPTPKGGKPSDEYGQRQMDRYLSKISGPLIDRVDIHIEVPAVPYKQLSSQQRGTDTAAMRELVGKARAFQQQRVKTMDTAAAEAAGLGDLSGVANSALSGRQLDHVAVLDDACRQLLSQAMTELGLSARAYDKIRRVSRTIADLEQSDAIQLHHLAEAIQYRLLDRQI